ncbi:MAG: XcbB/CpsF family capsular polysaccharide biosynthesis protein [Propionibacteriaceae bacterium]|jgi:hypothetical protein|nr:XcbB/CpsF family capsular polysaccharide biosynthesis protein [Propionibacteriaceae bacterium]
MINVVAFSTPATRDILGSNPFCNNRNYHLASVQGYKGIPEINESIGRYVPEGTHVVLFDFVPDAIFGTVFINGKKVTRNTWAMNFDGSESEYINRDIALDLDSYLGEVRHFIGYLTDHGITVVLNSFRYPNRMTIDNTGRYPLDKSFPSSEERKRLNNILAELEGIVQEEFPQVGIIHFNNKSSRNEKNHPVKRYSFYLNEDYYVDSYVQLENILKDRFPKEIPTYRRLKLVDVAAGNIASDGTVLLVESVPEVLRAAWNDESINEGLTHLAVNDFILDGQFGNVYRFIRRSAFYRSDLQQYSARSGNIVHYSDILDPVRLKSDKVQNILFFFLGMPGPKTVNSANAALRFAPHLFADFTRSLVKDTVVVRIADVDGVRGGYYIDSRNYLCFEDDVSEFIESKIAEYGVDRNRVVMNGTSKGAAGALYYGAKHDLSSVDIDPVLDGKWVIEHQRNNHFTRGFRVSDDLVARINGFLGSGPRLATHYVVGNHYVPETWDVSRQLVGINLVDIDDRTVKSHPSISPNSVPEWLMLINSLLFDPRSGLS